MSKHPSLSKIWREVQRPFRQLLTIVPTTLSYLLGARFYDLFLSGQVEVIQGKLPITGKVAIFLIFPDGGVKDSHLVSLRYLAGQGYAPLVVSNLALSETDRQKLSDHCWVCLQRPNYGYDFGGYREGIRFLGERINQLDRLLIVNDSTWFPVAGNSWLDRAEALGVDFAAASSNYGAPRPKAEDFRKMKWSYRTTHRNFHYCSFAFLFSSKLLRDRGFQKFWRNFPLTNVKTRTVRRGEIGLSQWVMRRGFSHGCTDDPANLDRDLAALSDARLREVAANLILPELPDLRRFRRELLASGQASRDDLIGLILTAVARKGSSYVLADYNMHDRGHAFLKKSPVWLDQESSDTTLKLASGLSDAASAVVLPEARALRAKRAPGFSPAPPG